MYCKERIPPLVLLGLCGLATGFLNEQLPFVPCASILVAVLVVRLGTWFMQSVGLVNDHLVGCPARTRVERVRESFAPPS